MGIGSAWQTRSPLWLLAPFSAIGAIPRALPPGAAEDGGPSIYPLAQGAGPGSYPLAQGAGPGSYPLAQGAGPSIYPLAQGAVLGAPEEHKDTLRFAAGAGRVIGAGPPRITLPGEGG